MKIFNLLLGLGFVASTAFSQINDFHFKQYTTSHGLSSSNIQGITQDHEQFIWIGTDNGLNRFDGYNFHTYKNIAGDSTSLSGNFIMDLFPDSKGNLWIGTRTGLNLYDQNQDNFKRIQLKTNYPDVFYIRKILEDQQKNLFVITNAGNVFGFDEKKQGFQFILHTEPEVKSMAFDYQNNLWIGNSKGLFQYNPIDSILIQHTFQGILANNNIEILFAYKNQIWIGTHRDGAVVFDIDNQEFSRLDLNSNYLGIFYQDRSGNIWIGTEMNLKIYQPKENRIHEIETIHIGNRMVSTAGVSAMFEDRQGNFWLAIRYGGLNLAHQQKAFLHNIFGPEPEINFTKNKLTSILIDHKDNLWVGFFENGIDIIDRKAKTKQHFDPFSHGFSNIGNGTVYALFEDSQQNIWIGTYFEGLQRFDSQANQFISYKKLFEEHTKIKITDVRSITEDKNQNLWIVTHGTGLIQFNPKTLAVTHFNNARNHLVSDWTTMVLIDHENTIWVAAAGGLSRLNADSRFTNYTNQSENPNSLSNNFVTTIYEDSQNQLWVGTVEGLNLFDRKTETFTRFNVNHGLKSDYICSILEDQHHNFWISTKEGLSRYKSESNTFKNYDVQNGTQANEFFTNSAYKSDEGEFFFGSVEGIIAFFPDSIRENRMVPEVVFTDFKLFNKSVGIGPKEGNILTIPKHISQSDKIKLEYNQNVISFEFVALNFIEPDKNLYAYKMEGFDQDWNYVGTKRIATYTNLHPGTYTFRVKASNNDGVWNEKGTSVKIIIIPPIWARWWFQSLMAIGLLFVILMLHLIRTRNIHSRNRELENRVNERTAELNQSNIDLQREIDERVRMEEEIIAEQERLDVTLRSIGDGVITTNTQGEVVLMNKIAEDLTGWSQEKARGLRLPEVFNIINEKTRQTVPNPVDQVLQTGEIVELANHTILIAKDGAELIIADSGAPIKDRKGNIIGVVLVFRDITLKTKIEQELQKANKIESLGILAGGIAHDFNNLLTAILSNLSLAMLDLDSGSELYQILTEIDNASLQARDLTQQLLTFSKGGIPLKATTDIVDVIKNPAVFALRGSNVRCQFNFAEKLWPVDIDRGQIGQVIHNLVLNATQAMSKGGEIHISAENLKIREQESIPLKKGDYVKISVRDHGIGIPHKYFQKIFDPFFTTTQKGNGLGLAISYSIIQKHDGYINLESELGKGTTFFIYLPASTKQVDATEEDNTPLPKAKGRVLVMDDEEFIRKSIKKMLKRLGYEVEVAIDGEEAIELFKHSRMNGSAFDVLIIDLTIPGGMGGKETLENLQEIDPDVRAIVSSGYSNDPVMANYEDHGFSGILSKPYKITDLSQVLESVLKS